MQTSKAISFHICSGHRLLYIYIFSPPGHPFGLSTVFIKFMGGFYTRMVGFTLHDFLSGCRTLSHVIFNRFQAVS